MQINSRSIKDRNVGVTAVLIEEASGDYFHDRPPPPLEEGSVAHPTPTPPTQTCFDCAARAVWLTCWWPRWFHSPWMEVGDPGAGQTQSQLLLDHASGLHARCAGQRAPNSPCPAPPGCKTSPRRTFLSSIHSHKIGSFLPPSLTPIWNIHLKDQGHWRWTVALFWCSRAMPPPQGIQVTI